MASDKRAEGLSVEAHEALSRAFCAVTEGQDWDDWDGWTNSLCTTDMQGILAHHGWVLVDADELARLRSDLETLADWVIGADHHPGCPGAFPPHRCKCGWPEAEAAARATLSPVDPRPEQPA